uniref:Uncharacterized protein n=1 Tax=Tanacetum cinerariifolium TaxID=118510 RepID=A0A699JHZ4_TANCI|nr:hypothetical protein [Tanacetum cinerariifolium]
MKTSKDVSKEYLKEMMQLVPVEEVYVESLQVKHPIIDWEIYSEDKKDYWKIIRLGGHIAVYQFFVVAPAKEFALLMKIRITLSQRRIYLSQRRVLVILGMYSVISPVI